jgi:hypothetical protein
MMGNRRKYLWHWFVKLHGEQKVWGEVDRSSIGTVGMPHVKEGEG